MVTEYFVAIYCLNKPSEAILIRLQQDLQRNDRVERTQQS